MPGEDAIRGHFSHPDKMQTWKFNLRAQLGLITAAAASPARRNASATLKGAVQQASKNT